MTTFVEGITSLISGVFKALLDALAGVGNLIFTMGENGTISGVTGFGWLLIIGISIPLATWLFGKVWTFIRSVGRTGK